MKDGQGLGAAWGTHSDLPYRARQGCNFSLAERQKPPRDVFPQELSYLSGPNSFGVDLLLLIRDAVFWDVNGDFLRFRQRTDPLVVIELLRGWVFLFLQKHQLCVEQEAAFFRQVFRGPLDRENVKSSKQTPPLPAPARETTASKCSCLSSVGPGALTGDSWTCGSEAIPVLFRPLLPHRAPCRFVPSTTPGNSRRLDALRTCGMSRGMRAVFQFLRQSAEPCAAPPTSPFMALLMHPGAVKAHARFPRCSS